MKEEADDDAATGVVLAVMTPSPTTSAMGKNGVRKS